VREALGQPIFERFVTAKEHEWQAFGRHISSWELSHYLESA
jgi:glutamine synthetase